MMNFEDISAIDNSYTFDFEEFLMQQYNLNNNLICKLFQTGNCQNKDCKNSHTLHPVNPFEKTIVCKHWLRGLCKKGEMCEFLHEYNLKKMPECWFFTKYGECSNPECMYIHVDPNSKKVECVWYARGFCRHGPDCKAKHVRKAVCQLYLTGFCPKGPNCSFGHPKYELPNLHPEIPSKPAFQNLGMPTSQPYSQQQQHYQQPQYHQSYQQQPYQQREHPYKPGFNMADVLCFKCNEKGHFANRFPNPKAIQIPR